MDLLKNLDNMITAEELSKNYTRLRSSVALKDLSDFAIEFAKLHVIKALKAASEQIEFDEEVLIRQSILQAYPLKNIK